MLFANVRFPGTCGHGAKNHVRTAHGIPDGERVPVRCASRASPSTLPLRPCVSIQSSLGVLLASTAVTACGWFSGRRGCVRSTPRVSLSRSGRIVGSFTAGLKATGDAVDIASQEHPVHGSDQDTEIDRVESSELAGLLTVVITTSPIHSDPEVLLIKTTMASLRSSVRGCPTMVVCDNVRLADSVSAHHGRTTAEGKAAYEDRLRSVEAAARAQEPWAQNCKLLRLPDWHGFAWACKAALREVDTEFVFIVQHDMALTQHVDLLPLIRVMQQRAEVQCVNLKKKSQRHYRGAMRSRQGLDVGPPQDFGSEIMLTRMCTFHDSPHVARTAWYREWLDRKFQFGRKIKRGQFTEFVATPWMLDVAKNEGLEALLNDTHIWLWELEAVCHIDGRKFLTPAGREAKGYPSQGSIIRTNVPSDGTMCEELAAVVQRAANGSPG